MAEADFIDVPIRTSRMLAGVFVILYAAAIVSVITVPVPWWIRVAGCTLLLASALLMVCRYAFGLGTEACSRIRISSDGNCELQLGNNRAAVGWLQAGWLASPLLVVARIRCNGERLARKIVLLPDSADSETLRRLRIFLRFSIARSMRRK